MIYFQAVASSEIEKRNESKEEYCDTMPSCLRAMTKCIDENGAFIDEIIKQFKSPATAAAAQSLLCW